MPPMRASDLCASSGHFVQEHAWVSVVAVRVCIWGTHNCLCDANGCVRALRRNLADRHPQVVSHDQHQLHFRARRRGRARPRCGLSLLTLLASVVVFLRLLAFHARRAFWREKKQRQQEAEDGALPHKRCTVSYIRTTIHRAPRHAAAGPPTGSPNFTKWLCKSPPRTATPTCRRPPYDADQPPWASRACAVSAASAASPSVCTMGRPNGSTPEDMATRAACLVEGPKLVSFVVPLDVARVVDEGQR